MLQLAIVIRLARCINRLVDRVKNATDQYRSQSHAAIGALDHAGEIGECQISPWARQVIEKFDPFLRHASLSEVVAVNNSSATPRLK